MVSTCVLSLAVIRSKFSSGNAAVAEPSSVPRATCDDTGSRASVPLLKSNLFTPEDWQTDRFATTFGARPGRWPHGYAIIPVLRSSPVIGLALILSRWLTGGICYAISVTP